MNMRTILGTICIAVGSVLTAFGIKKLKGTSDI
jgi:hypothetical protein